MITKSTSSALGFLRFPLACLVVLEHYYTPDIYASTIGASSCYHEIAFFINQTLSIVTVPLFLMIAGYLFFYDTDMNGFDSGRYFAKLKSRFKSLLIPYIAWNFIVLMFFFGAQTVTGNNSIIQKEGYKAISNYNATDFIKAFSYMDSTSMPIDGPLWFVRDLIIITLLAPAIYFLICKLKIVFPILLLIIANTQLSEFIPFCMAMCYFSIGACMQLCYNDEIERLNTEKSFKLSILIFLILLLILNALQHSNYSSLTLFCDLLYRIFGSMCLVAVAYKITSVGYRMPSLLTSASFFIFAAHKPILVLLRRLAFSTAFAQQEAVLILYVFLLPAIAIIFSIALFYIVKRWFPILNFLNGYRL